MSASINLHASRWNSEKSKFTSGHFKAKKVSDVNDEGEERAAWFKIYDDSDEVEITLFFDSTEQLNEWLLRQSRKTPVNTLF